MSFFVPSSENFSKYFRKSARRRAGVRWVEELILGKGFYLVWPMQNLKTNACCQQPEIAWCLCCDSPSLSKTCPWNVAATAARADKPPNGRSPYGQVGQYENYCALINRLYWHNSVVYSRIKLLCTSAFVPSTVASTKKNQNYFDLSPL